jgi:O-antigen ligase
LVFDASVSGGQPFWYSIVQGGNYFFYDEFSYFMHPTYAAMYFLFGIVITLEAVVSTKSRRLRTIYISVLIVFLLAIFLCSSRIVILCTALLVGGLFVKTVLARRSRRWILFGGAFLVLATFAITINPRFVGFQDSISLESFHHTRLEAWRSSIASLENHVFWGAGIGDERDALMASHLARGYTEGYEQRYNDHNEYFHIMNIGGVLAILSYLLVLGIPLGAAISNRDYVQFAFIMSFAVVCVVENLLVRRAGILYLIFFYCLFVPRARRVKSLTTPH